MIGLMRNIKINMAKEKFIKKYIKHIKQSEYVQLLRDVDEKDEVKSELYCVEIYDVLDNKCFNEVVNRLHALKKKHSSYKVDVNYRKSFIKKLQYVRVQIDYSSMGVVGEITFSKEKYIRNIKVLMTQINNNELVLCYTIYLKKGLKSYADIHDCIMENLGAIKKYRNCTWYVSDHLFEAGDINQIIKLEFEWLRDWFQATIEQLLSSSDIAKRYRLPVLFNWYILERSESCLSNLKNSPLAKCFSDEEEKQFLHIDSLDQDEGCLIERFSLDSRTESGILNNFSKYGNEFYYFIFYNIEISEVGRRLGRYFTSLKRSVNMQDYKWLINKIRAIKEREVIVSVRGGKDGWLNWVGGEKTEETLINYPTYQKKFLKIYKQYFEYINSLNMINYNSNIRWIALLSLIAVVIGTIIGILTTVWFNTKNDVKGQDALDKLAPWSENMSTSCRKEKVYKLFSSSVGEERFRHTICAESSLTSWESFKRSSFGSDTDISPTIIVTDI